MVVAAHFVLFLFEVKSIGLVILLVLHFRYSQFYFVGLFDDLCNRGQAFANHVCDWRSYFLHFTGELLVELTLADVVLGNLVLGVHAANVLKRELNPID
jgi:hypothetical protein